MSKLQDYEEKMKRNVVLIYFYFLNIGLDSLCQENGLTLDVWSQSLFKNELTLDV